MADAADLVRDPSWLAHSYDPAGRRVLMVQLSEADIAAASFLDRRILGPQTPAHWIPVQELGAAVERAGLDRRLGFIFHLGHVGSTLLSRLLGAHPSVLSLREPEALRTLARAPNDAALDAALRLWSRPFREGQLPIVKATSFCCAMATALKTEADTRAVFLIARPETYLATILGGENNHLDIQANAKERHERLNAALGSAVPVASYGEAVAMSWAAEMISLGEADGERVLWLDFDDLLSNPETTLRTAFAHFKRPVADAELAAIVAGPELRRYAKAPEHGYDATLRNAVLDQARRLYPVVIARGLAWLERTAAGHPALAEALSRSTRTRSARAAR